MIGIEIDGEHLAVAELARQIGVDLLSPSARAAEADRQVPDPVWKALLDTGLVAALPEELGGGGVPDCRTHLIAVEHFSYGDPGIALAAVWSGAAALLLARHGSAAHRGLAVALATDPQARAGIALYEGYGRAPSQFATSIRSNGNGELHVVGRKVGVAFGATADPLVVIGLDVTTGHPCAVLVPVDHPGVVVEKCDGGLALDAAATCSITIDVALPAENLIGHRDDNPRLLAGTVGRIRLATAAAQVGTAQRAIDYAAHYATERIAFGRPVSSYQGVSFPLAEAQINVSQARLEVAEIAELLDGDGELDTEELITQAVNQCAEVGSEATRTAVQTLGGHGFITDHPVELWYRSAAALSTFDFDPLRSSIRTAF